EHPAGRVRRAALVPQNDRLRRLHPLRDEDLYLVLPLDVVPGLRDEVERIDGTSVAVGLAVELPGERRVGLVDVLGQVCWGGRGVGADRADQYGRHDERERTAVESHERGPPER